MEKPIDNYSVDWKESFYKYDLIPRLYAVSRRGYSLSYIQAKYYDPISQGYYAGLPEVANTVIRWDNSLNIFLLNNSSMLRDQPTDYIKKYFIRFYETEHPR